MTETETTTDTTDATRYDPTWLIWSHLPQNTPLKSRVAVAAAIRNPDSDANRLHEFTGISYGTILDATASYFRGSFEKRGFTKESRNRDVPPDHRKRFSDFTPKKQAIIDFIAKYPDAREGDDDEAWTWNDVQNYLEHEYDVEVSKSYPINVARSNAEFIESHRETLKESGEYPEEQRPEMPPEVPSSLRERVEAYGELPDENLDEDKFDIPQDSWISRYRTLDLDNLTRGEEHRPDELPDLEDDEQVEIEGPQGSYKGPRTGIDARTQKLTHLSEVAGKFFESEREAIEVHIPVPLQQTLETEVEDGEYESVGEALIAHAVGEEVQVVIDVDGEPDTDVSLKDVPIQYRTIIDAVDDGAQTVEEVADTTNFSDDHVRKALNDLVVEGHLSRHRDGQSWMYSVSDSRESLPEARREAHDAALDEALVPLRGYENVCQREYDLDSNEHTAARLGTIREAVELVSSKKYGVESDE